MRRSRQAPMVALTRALNLPTGMKLRPSAWGRLRSGKPVQLKNRSGHILPDLEAFLYLDLAPGWTPESAVEWAQQSPLVEYAETDALGWGGAIPNDPQAAGQWHLDGTMITTHVNPRPAWDITTGSSNVIVAVLDSGIDSNLLEFAGRVVAGYDFANNDSNPADDHGHGTAVASVLAATGMNTNRGCGIDWQCRIMPVKVLEPYSNDVTQTVGSFSWFAQGINWAVAHGAKVINLSAGGWETTNQTVLGTAISNAVAAGCIFVTIAHNQPAWGISYPGILPLSITVGATDELGSNCAFSAWGPALDLVAPGTNIATVTTNNVWTNYWGTSLSAPQVSGAAALICSLRPNLNHYQVKDLLCAGAIDRGQKSGFSDSRDVPGWDPYYGWGRLNIYNSLRLTLTEVDRYYATNGADVVVSWSSPPNATTNRPYAIGVAASMTGSWMTATGLSYSSGRVMWRDDGVETGVHPSDSEARYYRVRIKTY